MNELINNGKYMNKSFSTKSYNEWALIYDLACTSLPSITERSNHLSFLLLQLTFSKFHHCNLSIKVRFLKYVLLISKIIIGNWFIDALCCLSCLIIDSYRCFHQIKHQRVYLENQLPSLMLISRLNLMSLRLLLYFFYIRWPNRNIFH